MEMSTLSYKIQLSRLLVGDFSNVESAKELWDSLESKYMAEDASSKKFLAINVSINYEHKDALDARMKRIKDGVAETKHIMQPVRVLRNPNSESMHNSMSDGVSASYGNSVSQPTMNPSRIKTGSNMGGDSAQSPLVSATTPLPPHQSNVDVAAIFRVSFTTVGDLEVLIKDIYAGIHEEVLSGMTNDKRKVVIKALGAMCELIETQRASNLPNDGLIYSIDDVAALFGLPLNSPKEIDEFTKDLETLLNMQKSTPIGDDRLFDKATPSDPVVQSVDINTKSTSYVGAAGASVKDQPTANFNFRPLVANHVFDGVNISIPRKVIKKFSTQFEHTLYGYFIGKRTTFLVVEYYARNNWAKHRLKRIIMNSKGFFFFKFDSRTGLEAVKLHDVPLEVFEEDGICLIATFIGKPVMLDSYTSAMCNDSWGRSSFARCLIEVNSEADLVDDVTIGIPSLIGDGFTKETIRVEYEWRPPRSTPLKNRYWKIPICYDDDDDEESSIPLKDIIISGLPPCVAITPVLLTKEPVNSLIMEDEHLDTIPATELDEVIKSSVENLVPIPSESEGIPDSMCNVPLCNNPSPLKAKDHYKIIVDSNDDYSSSDGGSPYGEDTEYVDASPPDSELVSLEVVENVTTKDGVIEDDVLREKLSKINLLIAKIEAMNSNPSPSSDFVTKSSSTSLNLFLEETNTFDISLTESETFCFDLEEKSSGSTTTHADFFQYDSFIFDLSIDSFPPVDRSEFYHEEFVDELAHIISPPEYDCFYFKSEPDPGELTSIVDFGIRENILPTTNVDLPFENDQSPLLAYVVWIFLPFLAYPVTPLYLLFCGNEDTIFDPGIAT
ncbi:hypothetical protein Tco_1379298 [Tanacetum coccineum]